MKLAGTLILWAAGLLGVYAFLFFDPTVSAGTFSVVNVHRLSFQQNMIMVASAAAVVGVILLIAGIALPRQQSQSDASETHAQRVESAVDGLRDQFSEALRSRDYVLAKRLLDSRSVTPDGCNRNGRGWLQLSVASESLENCKFLLDAGASPLMKDDIGTTAIQEADKRGLLEIQELFRHHVEKQGKPPSATPS